MSMSACRRLIFNNKNYFTKNMLFSIGVFSFGYFYYKSNIVSKMMKMNFHHNTGNPDPLWRSKAKMRLGDNNDVMIISGTANIVLAEEVAERLGMKLSEVDIKRYTDGEINIQILEEPRGKEVFIIQPTCTPVNENLFELLLLVSALKKGSCKTVTVVFPYYGYSALDKKNGQKMPIAAADVALMLEIVGVDKVAGIDLHSGQIQGFFHIPADDIESNVIMIDYILNANLVRDFNKLTIVSPEPNEVYRAKRFADILISKTAADVGVSLVVREKLGSFESEKMQLVGNVEGNECIILCNIIYSGNTVIQAADELYRKGAKSVYAFAPHGILCGNAIEALSKSSLKKIVITNTIPTKREVMPDKFIVLSSATLIAETIRRIYWNESLSEIFL